MSSEVEVGIGDRITLSDTGVVHSVNDTHVCIQRDDGSMRTYNLTGSSALKVRVIEKAYVDGGVYIDQDKEVFKYRAGSPGSWFTWNEYADEWEDVFSVAGPVFPVTRLV